MKGKTPNLRYFVAKLLSIVTILKDFRRAFNESHIAFAELSTKVSMLSENFWRDLRELFESSRRAFWRAFGDKIEVLLTNCMFSLNHIKRTRLSRKFENMRSAKALRDSVVVFSYFSLSDMLFSYCTSAVWHKTRKLQTLS